MRTIADIVTDLHRLERELIAIANEMRQMVPESCDRDNLMLAAYNRTGGAAAEVGRANRDFARAIREG